MTTPSVALPTAVSPPPRPEELLATLCHDVRTPLAVITTCAQLLVRQMQAGRADAAALARGLASIERNASRMANLLDEIFDLAQHGAGQPPALDLRPADLVALARRVVDEQQLVAGDRVIALAGSTTAVVGTWDGARLERVLTNLLTNAVKYSRCNGGIVVRVRRAEDAGAGAGAWAEVSVEDQGMGIPAGDLPHVFARFHRGSNVAGRVSGAGIGLASVRAIVERHGGAVAVASVEGRGTTVTVRLPLHSPGCAEDHEREPAPAGTSPHRRAKPRGRPRLAAGAGPTSEQEQQP